MCPLQHMVDYLPTRPQQHARVGRPSLSRELLVEQPDDRRLLNRQQAARRDRRCRGDANRLPRPHTLAEKSPGTSIATTASLPIGESTDSLTRPFWRDRTS